MAETDAGKVREALVHLTTQYQSQQIDQTGFHSGIGALKGNYVPLGTQITSYQECYDYYTEQDPCLEAVQLGKSHAAAPQPLTDKEIFFRGMYPHIKSPEEKKAFRELVQFSDEHKIPYTEYFKLLRGAFQKFSIEDKGSFEENMKQFHFQKFLLQCILYAAMYALSKTPPLTSDQLSRAPEGLKLYYQGFEETVLGHIERWEIMPVVGDSEIGEITAKYDIDRNQIITSRHVPFLSLFEPYGLSILYHELFHAHQDSRRIYQSHVFNELHAQLVGCIAVLKIERAKGQQQRKSIDIIKEEFGIRNDQHVAKLLQIRDSQVSHDDNEIILDLGLDREEMTQANLYYWDWAQVIMEGRMVPDLSLKKDFILRERVKYVVGRNFQTIKAALEQQIIGHVSGGIYPVSLSITQKLDRELEQVERKLVHVYIRLGVDPSQENRDEEVFKVLDSLSKEFLNDDLQFARRKETYEDQYMAVDAYYYLTTAKIIVLAYKAAFLAQDGSPSANVAREEFNQFDKEVFNPLVGNYMGVFLAKPSDGIE